MAAFAYRAVDGAGKAFSGVVEAVSAAAARADLRGRGLLPIKISAAQTASQPFRAALPLQALVLLNDPQFIEASRELASHALKEQTDFDGRLDFITTRLDGRKFDTGERKIVRKSLDSALATFRTQPDDAKNLITTGATPPRQDADVPELAAWTLLASQILNLDETITR